MKESTLNCWEIGGDKRELCFLNLHASISLKLIE